LGICILSIGIIQNYKCSNYNWNPTTEGQNEYNDDGTAALIQNSKGREKNGK